MAFILILLEGKTVFIWYHDWKYWWCVQLPTISLTSHKGVTDSVRLNMNTGKELL